MGLLNSGSVSLLGFSYAQATLCTGSMSIIGQYGVILVGLNFFYSLQGQRVG
ncbi:hypothetical protein BDZ91DRAFT_722982 [Kalaharituber pfeilii]|nr:hypothetical protein BDZ91DRAFT_722982 [Kalaharituber pfeilii]